MSSPLITEINTSAGPDSLAEALRGEPGVILLQSVLRESTRARYSFVAARPFLEFRSFGSRCELRAGRKRWVQFGNPWQVLDSLMARYELLDEIDLPFPLGGCFGFWGYDLKNFVEPKLGRRAHKDLDLPECHVGFYDSLVVFDHLLHKTWIVATGLQLDGSRNPAVGRRMRDFWRNRIEASGSSRTLVSDVPHSSATPMQSEGCATPACDADNKLRLLTPALSSIEEEREKKARSAVNGPLSLPRGEGRVRGGASELDFRSDSSVRRALSSNLSRREFENAVARAQRYIRGGDIYQVNLSHRLSVRVPFNGWELYQRLAAVSPAPFAAFYDAGDFQISSSSPELFLRLSGSEIVTRPIKGTRPRSQDLDRDAQLSLELQASEKERAELIMITDLLRNDLGKVCEYGSVHVPELVRLERYAQVQHLVSTIEGRLRPGVSHFAAFAACFPGGSITGAPKIRAMEIIDELEPGARGPYTGALGYLGFNRESQLSILIRSAISHDGWSHFQVGAGIVADSIPEAEYDETLAKAQGFLAALEFREPAANCDPRRTLAAT